MSITSLLKGFMTKKQRRGEHHIIQTSDDIELSMRCMGEGDPILLVHGFGANSHCMDVTTDHGIASQLSDMGKQAWLLDLRGSGLSDTPDTPWVFGDYVEKDLPAAVQYIHDKAGQKPAYLGHSMGGMIYYAFAASCPKLSSELSSSVLLGSTVDWPVKWWDDNLRNMLKYIPDGIPVKYAGQIMAAGSKAMKYLPDGIIPGDLNTERIDDKHLNEVHATLANTSSHLGVQFLQWLARYNAGDNKMLSKQTQKIDNSVNLPPTLMINGTNDTLAPPKRAKIGLEKLQNQPVDYLEAGEENGFTHNYNHFDLVIGQHIHNDLTPHMQDWFNEHRSCTTKTNQINNKEPKRAS